MDYLESIIEKYSRRRNFLIEMLMDVQHEKGYIPRESIFYLSKRLSVPVNEVMRIATFYKTFSLKPKAEHVIKVCSGVSCYIRGGREVVEKLENLLGIKVGDSTPDMKFSLELSSCSGRCASGPEIEIDGEVYGNVKPDDIEGILKKIG
ncbi:MAG: NAD(P)H-dependent oxidoreductase subunit E [Deltaproteobacteria bacterium]|nr:NAD(P)H-dependent oxidoreductase subunit E [Deltaproteobacteria bacterium]